MKTKNLPKKLLRFLIIAEDKYPPFRVDVVELFAKIMIEKGHRIDWIFQSKDQCDAAKEVFWNNCRAYVAANKVSKSRMGRLKNSIDDLINDVRMFSLARKNNYDFIQVKDKFLSAILAIFAAKINNCHFIFWLSYPIPEASIYEAKIGVARYPIFYFLRGHCFKFILYKLIARWAKHIFVQSEQMKNDVMREGVPQEKLTAVPMGVSQNMLEFQSSIKNSDLRLENKSIVYLGTLLKTRKLDFIITVFAKVLEHEPNANLYMVGPEEQEGDLTLLQETAADLNVAHKVTFTGRLTQLDALTYVSKASVCVSPFFPTPILNSTSPTKLIEYMAMKKAYVANDHPEQSLVTAESGGGICVPYEITPFANAIVKLLSHPTLAQEMGEKGYKYVINNRTYDHIAANVENSYYKILEAID